MKALAKEPDARYSEALQLQVALEQWLVSHQHSANPAELSAFLHKVYADRLAREARSGGIVVEEDPPLTGQRTAVEGHRRSGLNPSVSSSRDVTRADRGELVAAAEEAVEATDRSPPRPSRVNRSIDKSLDVRREPETPDRQRAERRPSNPRQQAEPARQEPVRPPVEPARPQVEPARLPVEPRRQAFAEMPTEALDASSIEAASLITGTTQAPRRDRARRRWVKAVTVAASAVLAALLLWLSLRPESPPSLATARLETVPSGARVMFDGKLLPDITPLTLPSVPAGAYAVVVTREGYQELRATVAIPPSGTVTLGTMNLMAVRSSKEPPAAGVRPPPVTPPPSVPGPASVQLTLETEPAQATIFVNGEERGLAPQVVQVRADQELDVKVSAPQYRALSRKLKVGMGPAQVERIVLEPLPKTPPIATIKQTRVVEPPKPAPEQPKAMVRFAVTPWAEVTCGGRNLGTTPFEAVSLPVGVYQCKFYNPDLARTLTQRVEVKATGMNKVVVKF
jgi:hypothetical protein